jgi:mRNA-degrading endonuclease toxin of MazEF toxin-antitoxin module
MNPRPGEVYWVDLGLKGKLRPLLIVSREDDDAPRALASCVPLTTELKGGQYEVPLPRVKFLPGNDRGVVNIQGITAVEHFRLGRRAGEFFPAVLAQVKDALAYLLELDTR